MVKTDIKYKDQHTVNLMFLQDNIRNNISRIALLFKELEGILTIMNDAIEKYKDLEKEKKE